MTATKLTGDRCTHCGTGYDTCTGLPPSKGGACCHRCFFHDTHKKRPAPIEPPSHRDYRQAPLTDDETEALLLLVRGGVLRMELDL